MTTDFGELYARYANDVYRFALYLSGDPAQAEDIASETFVRVWTAPEQPRLATVKAYLFTIARNLYLQGLRKDSHRINLDEHLPDHALGPEAAAEQRAELQAVFQALQQLPEVDRAALLMHAQDEMPYEEIALALGLSLAAVKVKIYRARLKLVQLRMQQEAR
jgi:RNA polymerase sigma-70 factor (ECF subfamily)